jgi:hypothetical protein
MNQNNMSEQPQEWTVNEDKEMLRAPGGIEYEVDRPWSLRDKINAALAAEREKVKTLVDALERMLEVRSPFYAGAVSTSEADEQAEAVLAKVKADK